MIIVGAGIIGLSCAWRLAQAGRRVRVFDRRSAACEASWAGAGMLAPGGEMEADSPLSRMALRSLSIYADFVEELTAESGVAIDYRSCGGIDLAATDEKAERQAQAGIRSERCEYRGRPARFYPDDAVWTLARSPRRCWPPAALAGSTSTRMKPCCRSGVTENR